MTKELVLVDTSIWIDCFDKRVDPKVKTKLETLLLEQQAVITPLIQLELLGGAPNEKEYEKLKQDLEALPQLDLVSQVWSSACRLSFQLRRSGLTIPNVDILLSALVLHYRCRLWHRDRHFELIAKHADLRFY